MRKANELSELMGIEALTEGYIKTQQSGEFAPPELFVLCRLTELYRQIKRGMLSREEGQKRQKEIFMICETEPV